MSKIIEVMTDAIFEGSTAWSRGEHSTAELTAKAAIEVLRKAGYAIVPVEPTEAMVHAAVMTHVRENGGIEHSPSLSWKAMIRAANKEGV